MPVVLSVPHAGRFYPDALLRSSRLPHSVLETLEDRLVDRLIWRAQARGASAIVAQAPRAEIDLNRDPREIEPHMVVPPPPTRSVLQSPRTRSGLGLVPSRIGGAGSIWLDRLPEQELRRRIVDIHAPYHEAVADLLGRARDRFGVAILLDCHSMPPREDRSGPKVVFGDRHGTSIRRDYLEAAADAAAAAGYSFAVNVPYAGGYVTARHGRPAENIHALQLELDRSVYLDAALKEPGKGFDDAARLIAAIVAALSAKALDVPPAMAAE